MFLGMVTSQALQQAETMDSSVDTLQDLSSTVRNGSSALEWFGPDRDVFEEKLSETMAQWAEAIAFLARLAADLRSQAEEQERTSQSDESGGSHGGGTPGPGSAPGRPEVPQFGIDLGEFLRRLAEAANPVPIVEKALDVASEISNRLTLMSPIFEEGTVLGGVAGSIGMGFGIGLNARKLMHEVAEGRTGDAIGTSIHAALELIPQTKSVMAAIGVFDAAATRVSADLETLGVWKSPFAENAPSEWVTKGVGNVLDDTPLVNAGEDLGMRAGEAIGLGREGQQIGKTLGGLYAAQMMLMPPVGGLLNSIAGLAGQKDVR